MPRLKSWKRYRNLLLLAGLLFVCPWASTGTDFSIGPSSIPIIGGVGGGVGTSTQFGQLGINTAPATNESLDVQGVANVATPAVRIKKGTASNSGVIIQEADNTGKLLEVLQPGDIALGQPTLFIDNGAFLSLRSSLLVSGTGNGLTFSQYNLVQPTADVNMIGVNSDVNGPSIQAKSTLGSNGGYNFSSISSTGNYTFSIEEGPMIRFGAGATRASMDVSIARTSATAIEVDNGTVGTFRDIVARGVGVGVAPNGQNVITFTNFVFANIATTLTANGQIGYCSDCTIANPCAGAGTGAIAKRLNGINVCN